MAARWMRAPKPVTVELAERLSDTMIINESYSKTYRHNEVESLIIYNQLGYSISGKLCVKDDGSVYVRNPGELNDASYEFIRYDLVIPDQPMDQTPQRCILLETKSQLESLKRHFVHWNLSGPTVKCQELQYNDSDGPQVDTSNDDDNKFVWVIPPERSNHFSLQSFDRSYYLAFGSDGKATLCRGGASDQQHNSIFRLES